MPVQKRRQQKRSVSVDCCHGDLLVVLLYRQVGIRKTRLLRYYLGMYYVRVGQPARQLVTYLCRLDVMLPSAWMIEVSSGSAKLAGDMRASRPGGQAFGPHLPLSVSTVVIRTYNT